MVDAGKDTTYCIGQYAHTMYLGDLAIIKNGVEPYSISWECNVELSEHLTYTVKDFLNDKTLLSPADKSETFFQAPEGCRFLCRKHKVLLQSIQKADCIPENH